MKLSICDEPRASDEYTLGFKALLEYIGATVGVDSGKTQHEQSPGSGKDVEGDRVGRRVCVQGETREELRKKIVEEGDEDSIENGKALVI